MRSKRLLINSRASQKYVDVGQIQPFSSNTNGGKNKPIIFHPKAEITKLDSNDVYMPHEEPDVEAQNAAIITRSSEQQLRLRQPERQYDVVHNNSLEETSRVSRTPQGFTIVGNQQTDIKVRQFKSKNSRNKSGRSTYQVVEIDERKEINPSLSSVAPKSESVTTAKKRVAKKRDVEEIPEQLEELPRPEVIAKNVQNKQTIRVKPIEDIPEATIEDRKFQESHLNKSDIVPNVLQANSFRVGLASIDDIHVEMRNKSKKVKKERDELILNNITGSNLSNDITDIVDIQNSTFGLANNQKYQSEISQYNPIIQTDVIDINVFDMNTFDTIDVNSHVYDHKSLATVSYPIQSDDLDLGTNGEYINNGKVSKIPTRHKTSKIVNPSQDEHIVEPNNTVHKNKSNIKNYKTDATMKNIEDMDIQDLDNDHLRRVKESKTSTRRVTKTKNVVENDVHDIVTDNSKTLSNPSVKNIRSKTQTNDINKNAKDNVDYQEVNTYNTNKNFTETKRADTKIPIVTPQRDTNELDVDSKQLHSKQTITVKKSRRNIIKQRNPEKVIEFEPIPPMKIDPSKARENKIATKNIVNKNPEQDIVDVEETIQRTQGKNNIQKIIIAKNPEQDIIDVEEITLQTQGRNNVQKVSEASNKAIVNKNPEQDIIDVEDSTLQTQGRNDAQRVKQNRTKMTLPRRNVEHEISEGVEAQMAETLIRTQEKNIIKTIQDNDNKNIIPEHNPEADIIEITAAALNNTFNLDKDDSLMLSALNNDNYGLEREIDITSQIDGIQMMKNVDDISKVSTSTDVKIQVPVTNEELNEEVVPRKSKFRNRKINIGAQSVLVSNEIVMTREDPMYRKQQEKLAKNNELNTVQFDKIQEVEVDIGKVMPNLDYAKLDNTPIEIIGDDDDEISGELNIDSEAQPRPKQQRQIDKKEVVPTNFEAEIEIKKPSRIFF